MLLAVTLLLLLLVLLSRVRPAVGSPALLAAGKGPASSSLSLLRLLLHPGPYCLLKKTCRPAAWPGLRVLGRRWVGRPWLLLLPPLLPQPARGKVNRGWCNRQVQRVGMSHQDMGDSK